MISSLQSTAVCLIDCNSALRAEPVISESTGRLISSIMLSMAIAMLPMSRSEASAVVNLRTFLDIHQLILTNSEVQLIVDLDLVVTPLFVDDSISWSDIHPVSTLVVLNEACLFCRHLLELDHLDATNNLVLLALLNGLKQKPTSKGFELTSLL